jgi:two-component system, cell cycle sensor histidine kinase and response regulator CckA
VASAFREIAATGAPKRLGYRVSDQIGRIRNLESQWSVMRDASQKITNVVVVSRDVTEREEAAKTIREQAELLNQARDAIFVRDMEQRVTYWNKGAERLYGWRGVEVIGRKASDFLYKAGSPQRKDIWKTVLEKGEWQGELTQVNREGKELCIASRRTLLRNVKREPIAILNINTDITEKKSLEAQVLRSQRLDSIGSLASGIAHDLNNVLAPILMATEMVWERVEDPESRRMLDVAKNSARRGADLVKQILQFARGTKGEHGLVSLPALVKDLAKMAKNTFPPLIKVEANCDVSELQTLGDMTQLHQVLLNLCVNARDAMPEGGSLSIGLKCVTLEKRFFRGHSEPVSGRYIELSVRDTGTGIPANVLPRIFEPFFSTKTEDNGTGLGLSTVLTIVKNHHGFMDVSTEVGKGTVFNVYFPLASEDTDSTKAPTGVTMPTGNGEWILLVDDEQALLEMTRELLEAYGYNVITAKDGSEALIQFGAHQSKISVVVTDLLMPGVGGQQLINTIHEISPKVIAICLSGSADGNGISTKGKGATAFLRKPCATADLLAALSRALAPK